MGRARAATHKIVRQFQIGEEVEPTIAVGWTQDTIAAFPEAGVVEVSSGKCIDITKIRRIIGSKINQKDI